MSDDEARAINRAAFIAAAQKYLRPERQQHAELLGHIMTSAIDAISAVASVNIQAEGIPAKQLEQLGKQVGEHAERIAHAAAMVLVDVYTKTLLISSSVPIENDHVRLN